MENWLNFVKEFSDSILPIYKKHEDTFDVYNIHGSLHISRSIIFSEFMARYYKKIGIDVDFNAIRYAVAFHDSGRQGNGIDLWETDSSKKCYTYLSKKYNSVYCKYVSNLIVKKIDNLDVNKKIVTDADVIEIMRPICGHGGILGFNSKYLSFLIDDTQVRNDLIFDAWKLIKYSEDNQHLFTDNNHLYKLLEILNDNKSNFKILTF